MKEFLKWFLIIYAVAFIFFWGFTVGSFKTLFKVMEQEIEEIKAKSSKLGRK